MIYIKTEFVALIVMMTLSTSAQSARADNAYMTQYQRAVQGAIANLLPNGAVIASPSHSNPDYYYDWVRDTSLTMKTLIQLQLDSHLSALAKKDIARRIDRWVDWELARQETPTKLTDQGEPRFYVDGRANREPWGRPQNDGPALRALATIELANQWIQQGHLDWVKAKLYKGVIPANTLIKRDLEYVAHHWGESSYDLWEEERAMHYYTLTAQMVALTKGAKLAKVMDDNGGATFYGQQAVAIQNYLKLFIDPNTGIIKYAINKVVPLPHKKSPLDVAVLLIANQTFDGKYYVPMKETVATMNALTKVFKNIYPINKDTKLPNGQPLGTAIGRYPEDVYSGFDFGGGNPWFISTLALAEFACNMDKAGYAPGQHQQLRNLAMAQFNRVLKHLPPNGTMSEQFRRDNGFEQGAHDLTWSYTSYITAYRACF
ncbi:MAG: hypothetical protein JST80_11255 [Bdellovibrionales bacterium]|nr:hypothetical protein [Bdellovibrionales bacterium]